MTCVSMGNPHAIVFMNGVKDLDIEKIGPKFEHHSCFPNRTNTEFVEILDRKMCLCASGREAPGRRWPVAPDAALRRWRAC